MAAQAAHAVDAAGARADVAGIDRISVGVGGRLVGIEDARRSALHDGDLAVGERGRAGQLEQRPGHGVGAVRAAQDDDPPVAGGAQDLVGFGQPGMAQQVVRWQQPGPAIGEAQTRRQALVAPRLAPADRDHG